MAGNIPLVPSYENCFVQDTQDALLLVQAVVDNMLPSAERRPQDSERAELIKSGNIFIFDERRGHIQRWTDGISWSPSRILGEFLLYREKNLDGRIGSGNSTRRNSRYYESLRQGSKWVNGVRKSVPRRPQSANPQQAFMNPPPNGKSYPYDAARYIADYNLYGSLMSSEQYKENGLIKKTISIPYGDSSYRLISYYVPHDVELGLLRVPSEDEKFSSIVVNPDLAVSKNVKVPIVLNSLSSPRSSVSSYSSTNSRNSMNSLTNSMHSMGGSSIYGSFHTPNTLNSRDNYSYGSAYPPRYSTDSETSSHDSTARYSTGSEVYDRCNNAKMQDWMLPFQTYQKVPSSTQYALPLASPVVNTDLNVQGYFPSAVRQSDPGVYDYEDQNPYDMRRYSESSIASTPNVQQSAQSSGATLYDTGRNSSPARMPSMFQPDLPKHPLSPSSSSSSIPGMSASLISADAGGPEMYAPSIKTESDMNANYEDDIPIFAGAELTHTQEELVSGRR